MRFSNVQKWSHCSCFPVRKESSNSVVKSSYPTGGVETLASVLIIGCILNTISGTLINQRWDKKKFRWRRHHFDVPTLLQQTGFNQSALHPLLLLPRHTASTRHFLSQSISQGAQIINIYCTSVPHKHPSSLAPPASPNLCFICSSRILHLNTIFSFSVLFFRLHALHLLGVSISR